MQLQRILLYAAGPQHWVRKSGPRMVLRAPWK